MAKLTLKTPGDIPAVVEAFLGFTPSDSLVIMSIGGGPSARVDITVDTVADAVGAMAVAAPHWTNGVIVAVYSETVDAVDVGHAIAATMPQVSVRATVTVRPDRTVVDDTGATHAPTSPDMPDEVRARRLADSRAELEAEAAEVEDAPTAWILARESYRAGNGARAWVYLDRYVKLNHGHSLASKILERFLREAIDPASEAARALFDND
jgi:pyocin large subunit-like protein